MAVFELDKYREERGQNVTPAAAAYDHAAKVDYSLLYHNGETRNYQAADRVVYDGILADIITPRDTVLEIGSGTGDTLKHLAWRISPENYLGIDPSRGMCQEASMQYPGYIFLPMKAQDVDLPENYYDKAISIFAPPSYDAEGYAGSVFRALKPGGIYVSGPYTHLMAFGPRLQPNMIDQYPDVPRNFFLESQDEYKSMLEAQGFEVVDEIGVDYATHQQVHLDASRGRLQSVDAYYNHMQRFDSLAHEMGIRATDFRHALYVARKPNPGTIFRGDAKTAKDRVK